MKLFRFVPFVFFVMGCGGGGGVSGVGPGSNNLGIVVPLGPTPEPELPRPVGNVLMSVGASAYPTGRYSSRADLWEPALAADFRTLNLVSGDVVEFTIFPRFQQVTGADGPAEVRNLRIRVVLPAQLELAGSRLDPARGFHWGYPSTGIAYFGAEQLATGVEFGDVQIYLDRFPSMEFRVRATATPVGPMMIELRSDNFPPQDVKITF
ncbi:MAG: hypothetical protein WAP74_03780 [Patescibacteria group bacterium]